MKKLALILCFGLSFSVLSFAQGNIENPGNGGEVVQVVNLTGFFTGNMIDGKHAVFIPSEGREVPIQNGGPLNSPTNIQNGPADVRCVVVCNTKYLPNGTVVINEKVFYFVTWFELFQ